MALIDNIRKMFGLQTETKEQGSVMGYFNVGTQQKMYKYQGLQANIVSGKNFTAIRPKAC